MIQCNEDPRKRNIVLNRGVVVPHSTTTTGYNYALAPNSDAYLPDVQVEGGATRKTVPLAHQGTLDPPDIAITEGGGNRRKLLSLPPKGVELDQSTIAPIETVVDVPGISGGFYALANRGGENEKGKTDDMDWYAMRQEEAKDQKNNADRLDICLLDIISCYWKPNNGMLMLRITGLNRLGEYVIKAEDVKVDYPDTLAILLIGTIIGEKRPGRTASFGRLKNGLIGLRGSLTIKICA